MKIQFLFCSLLLLSGTCVYGQERSIVPYAGGSVSVSFTGERAGFGAELGIISEKLYIGVEGGGYGYPPLQSSSSNAPIAGEPFQPYSGGELYLGVHTGWVINSNFYLGIVGLLSYAYTWVSPDVEISKRYFNIGPDIRVRTSSQSHLYLNGAYTARRGLKFGLGYLF